MKHDPRFDPQPGDIVRTGGRLGIFYEIIDTQLHDIRVIVDSRREQTFTRDNWRALLDDTTLEIIKLGGRKEYWKLLKAEARARS